LAVISLGNCFSILSFHAKRKAYLFAISHIWIEAME